MKATMEAATVKTSTVKTSTVKSSAAHLGAAQIGGDGENGENNGKDNREFACHGTFLPNATASETHQTPRSIYAQLTNLSL